MKGTGQNNYVLDSIVRKHVLARARSVQGWEQCSLETLMSLSVDQCKCLQSLPRDWLAAEASLLICCRADWPMLVSMYLCLWHEAADTMPEAQAVLAAALQDGQAEKVISDFRQRNGFAPHPETLMEALTRAGPAGTRSASTPAEVEADPA